MKEIHAALHNAGYRASQFHHEPHALKTDAPAEVVWDILRCLCKKNPPLGNKKKKRPSDDAGTIILAREPKLQADFSIPKELRVKVKEDKERLVPKFPSNPGR